MKKLMVVLLVALFSAPIMAEQEELDLSDAHAKVIFSAATFAGVLRACGEPWENYYLTFMQIERAKARDSGLPEEPMAKMIGFMFGLAQAQAHKQIEADPERDSICSQQNLDKVKDAAMQALREAESIM